MHSDLHWISPDLAGATKSEDSGRWWGNEAPQRLTGSNGARGSRPQGTVARAVRPGQSPRGAVRLPSRAGWLGRARWGGEGSAPAMRPSISVAGSDERHEPHVDECRDSPCYGAAGNTDDADKKAWKIDQEQFDQRDAHMAEYRKQSPQVLSDSLRNTLKPGRRVPQEVEDRLKEFGSKTFDSFCERVEYLQNVVGKGLLRHSSQSINP